MPSSPGCAWRPPAPFDARIYVDTGPIQERVFAQYAGLGWIGRNTCLIDPDLGSWLFLGCLISSLPLDPDSPGVDQCGECVACLSACPTGALVGPGELDATRCISYLTIEQRKAIPEALRPLLGSLVYGCDICQDVCPWNRNAPVSDRPEWAPRAEFDATDVLTLWKMSDAALDAAMRGTPMERAGTLRLRRNLAVALANAGPAVAPEQVDGDADPARPSIRDPNVAAARQVGPGPAGGTNRCPRAAGHGMIGTCPSRPRSHRRCCSRCRSWTIRTSRGPWFCSASTTPTALSASS